MSTQQKLSQNAIGKVLGLSSAGMSKLKKQGMPVDSVEAAQAWRVKNQNVAARKPWQVRDGLASAPAASAPPPPAAAPASPPNPAAPPSSGDESHNNARTRREIAEANLAELKLRELSGELLPRTLAEKAAAELGRQVRDALQASRRRLSPYLASASSVTECEELLRQDHQLLLDNLAAGLSKVVATEALQA